MRWDRLTDATLRATQRAFATSRTVIYTPTGGSPVDLSGRVVFREASTNQVLDGQEVEVQTTGPQLSVRLVDLPVAPAEGDRVEVDAEVFQVSQRDLDGEGAALLHLEEV